MPVEPEKVAHEYLEQGKVMQLGTMHDGKPRVNSVYYVSATNGKAVYWMSEPTRRHSMDIIKHPQASAAIAVKVDYPVAGIQFEGDAEEVTDFHEIQKVAKRYGAKYSGYGGDLHERYAAGTNKHHLYKLRIHKLELFDEVNFPGGEVVNVSLD